MPRERKNAKNKDLDGEPTTKGKKKRGSAAANANSVQNNAPGELLPPAPNSRDTLFANNPFDDYPSMMNQHRPPMGQGMPMNQYGQPGKPNDKVYPMDRPRVFNPTNPHAPPVYLCGICHKEVHDNDQAIMCESGCSYWYHRACTGLTENAYALISNEVYAEWACNACFQKSVPIIKCKP